MTYITKGEAGSNLMYTHGIPTLNEVFKLIEKGKLDLEEDEVISYYYDFWDKENNKICVSSFHQVMKLYELKDLLI